MNAKTTSAVGLFALFALFLRTLAPEGKGSTTYAPSPERIAATKAVQPAPKATDADGPWVATCRFAGFTPDESFCRDALTAYTVRTLIATVPDAAHSRLGLFTDRAIESLQHAVHAAGWDSDTVWFPAPDKQAANRQPGVMLFRSSQREADGRFSRAILLVFLVGETPTAGLNLEMLGLAERYSDRFAPEQAQRYLVGPTFSGSLPSLARHMASDPKPHSIVSGTVTFGSYIEALKREPRVDFDSTAVSSEDTLNKLCSVADRLLIPHDRVVVLAEGETSFARGYEKRTHAGNTCDVRLITFPREISSLRNAYKEATAPQKGQANPVPLSLRDVEGGEDSTPVVDRFHTPQSQYAVLNNIAGELRGRIRLVEIVATNVMDAVFLANVIHEGAPDARIAVSEADLLFVRAAADDSLSGTLAISPFPMTLWTQDRHTIPFPDATSQGVYNAAVRLLRKAGLATSDLQEIDGSQHPGVLEATPWGYFPMELPVPVTAEQLPRPPRAFRIIAFFCSILLCLAIAAWRKAKREPETRMREAMYCGWPRRLLLVSLACMVGAMLSTFLLIRFGDTDLRLMGWRGQQLASGVSWVVPLLLLLSAVCVWSLVHMTRISLAAHRDPGLPLPPNEAIRKQMELYLHRAEAAINCTHVDRTLEAGLGITGLLLLALLRPDRHLATLNPWPFTWSLALLSEIGLVTVALSVYRCRRIWTSLRGVLTQLDALNLDGAFRRIPREFSAAIWLQLPNLRDYHRLYRSAECIRPEDPELTKALNELRVTEAKMAADREAYGKVNRECLQLAEKSLQRLQLAWNAGACDPDPGKDKPCDTSKLGSEYLRLAEFVTLRYAAWIRYVVMHMRNLVWHASIAFALTALALSSLNFQSPQAIRYFLTAALLAFGVPLVIVMMQVERNPVLSRLADTQVGAIGPDFYLKGITYGVLPLLGVLANDFPGVSKFLTGWLQPTLESLK